MLSLVTFGIVAFAPYLRYNNAMDPNGLPATPAQTPVSPPTTPEPKPEQPAVAQVAVASSVKPIPQVRLVAPVSHGHPEAERIGQARPVEIKAPAPVVESGPLKENRAVVEAQANLQLAKEIMPGVHELHTVNEPITLPSQITEAGVSSTPLPLGAATYKRDDLKLPLTQAEIVGGLHQSVKKAARWLAEWCKKQIKEAHRMLKNKEARKKG